MRSHPWILLNSASHTKQKWLPAQQSGLNRCDECLWSPDQEVFHHLLYFVQGYRCPYKSAILICIRSTQYLQRWLMKASAQVPCSSQPIDPFAKSKVESDGIGAMAGMCLTSRIVLVVQLAHIISSDLLPPISCYMVHCTPEAQGSDFAILPSALWTWQAPARLEVQH